jgi:hypothetical protein
MISTSADSVQARVGEASPMPANPPHAREASPHADESRPHIGEFRPALAVPVPVPANSMIVASFGRYSAISGRDHGLVIVAAE